MQKVQKSHNVVYGIIGMLFLFLFGGFIGYIINGSSRINTASKMTETQCQDLANKIIDAANNNNPDLLRQLNEIFSENCNGRRFTKTVVKPKVKKIQSVSRTDDICERVERIWLDRLTEMQDDVEDVFRDSQYYIDRAKIYANLADRGCKENSEAYKELAKKDLEIARALNHDSFNDRHEATEMVETYKKLQMQAEATKMIEKAKKLANPAIDFIIQLEKIIEE